MKCCFAAVVAFGIGGSLVAHASAATMKLNLDANSIAGVTGATVSTWTDSSGNGNNATANVTAPSSAPTLQLSALNGQSAVNFVGTASAGQSLNMTVSPALSQPYTIFLVGKMLGDDPAHLNSTDYFYDGVSTRIALGINGTGTNQNNLFAYANGASNINTAITIPGTGYHLYEVAFNGATSQVYLDGTQIISGDPGSAALGAERIGARTSISNFLNGQIATMQVYTDGATTLTTAERNQIGSGLQTKYGLTGAYVVPEPGTAVLMLLGLVGIALTVKRRIG